MSVNSTDRNTKILASKQVTDSNKAIFEELGANPSLIVTNDQIWIETVANDDPVTAVGAGIATFYSKLVLTEDTSVANQQSWSSGQTNWISDRFGASYTPKLFDNADSQIFPTDALDWFFDAPTGLLTINGNAGLFSQPFKLDGYTYSGQLGLLNPTDGYSDFIIVATVTARNAVPSSERAVGFTAFVQSTGVTYRLIDGVTDNDWIIIDRTPITGGVTLYVDSGSGDDDNDGSVSFPLATLEEAVARIPDPYDAANIIECLGAGPYPSPAKWPRPTSGGSLYIVGDRSTPIVTNASPTYTLVAGTNTRWESTSFGAHSGLTSDGYWMGLFDGTFGLPIYATGSGTSVEVIATQFSPDSISQTVYQTITEINFENISESGTSADGGESGINFGGCIINSGSSSNERVKGLNFRGCNFIGRGNFIDCKLGGHLGGPGANNWIQATMASPTSEVVDLLVTSGGSGSFLIVAGDKARVRGYFELELGVDIGCNLLLNKSDFRPLSGPCIDMNGSSSLEIPTSGISVGGGAENVIRTDTNGRFGGITISSPSNGVITGSVSGDAFILQNGSGITNVDDITSGLTVGGADLVLDGMSFDFADIPIFSLDSGCYART